MKSNDFNYSVRGSYVKTDSVRSDTGDYPVVWLLIQVLHPVFTFCQGRHNI